MKQNLAPRGGLSAAHKRPRCDSTLERLIHSPISVPLVLVVKNALKDLVRLPRWKSHAGIADRDQQLTILAALRLDGEFARSPHILYRVDPIHHEVHQHLLQLHAISHDLRDVCSEFRPN